MFGLHFTCLKCYPSVSVLLQYAKPSRWSSAGLVPLCVGCPCAGEPKTSVLQVLSHRCWIEGNNHFPWPAGCFGSDTQHAVGLLGRDALLVHVQLVHQDPPILLCQAAFQPVSPAACPGAWGYSISRCKILHLPLLTFTRVSPFFQPAEVPLNGSQPFSVLTTAPD